MKRLILSIITLIELFLVSYNYSQASSHISAISPVDAYPLFSRLYGILLTLTLTISFWRIIVGGFKLTTSQGDPNGITEGKEILTSAIMGIVFAVMGLAILRYVLTTIVG